MNKFLTYLKKELTYYFYKFYYRISLTLAFLLKRTEINKIRLFAYRKHNHIRQRYAGKYPYFYHLNIVGEYVELFYKECGFTEEEFIDLYKIAMLHDFIEDIYTYTYNDVKKLFGETVANGVYACTELKGRNRKERHGSYYIKGILADTYGHMVKLCDICGNMSFGSRNGGNSMFKMYCKEYPKNKELLYIERFDYIFKYMEMKFISAK